MEATMNSAKMRAKSVEQQNLETLADVIEASGKDSVPVTHALFRGKGRKVLEGMVQMGEVMLSASGRVSLTAYGKWALSAWRSR